MRNLSRPTARFNLTRWFFLLGVLSITLFSSVTPYVLSRFLTAKMLERDGELTMQFVGSIVETQHAAEYFLGGPSRPDDANLLEFFRHVSLMPDVLRANVFAGDGSIIWSSDEKLIARRFAENDELAAALDGRVVVKSDLIRAHAEHDGAKLEHVYLESDRFVENYVPVRHPESGAVIGAVEFYRVPRPLFQAIEEGTRLVWLCAAAVGLVLFATLFWAVRRADAVMRRQEQRLVETETLATVGEMAVAIAHGIRNPLAIIRSSAELNAELEPGATESAQTIIDQVDRLEMWLRDLLTYSQPDGGRLEPVRLDAALEQSLRTFSSELHRRGIEVVVDIPSALPPVRGDPVLLAQLFHNLLSNALEAIEGSGRIEVRAASRGRLIQVEIVDTGAGIEESRLRTLFVPFQTSKPKGLGVGLPLVRRIVSRFGGAVRVDSAPGRGTTVTVDLVVAE
ncbi:MAG: two-component sensor histidine kinase [Ectothiorhodospiraceae bacterium]|nr:two-component sensor histidine kinase [Ectothiorhodospiraceae bacterium]